MIRLVVSLRQFRKTSEVRDDDPRSVAAVTGAVGTSSGARYDTAARSAASSPQFSARLCGQLGASIASAD
jgi:hypothetical protein